MNQDNIALFSTFTEWNNYLQSVEKVDLDEFLPELGMTNLELRKFVFKAEKSGYITEDKFLEEMEQW